MRRGLQDMHFDVLRDWGDELPGLPLNLFADELPAAYLRSGNHKGLASFPVLRRCEVLAKTRRALFACAVDAIRSHMSGEIYCIDEAIRDGRMGEYVWAWASELPAAFEERYDRDFFRRMLSLSLSMWERMEEGIFTVPICTAEEILLGLVLDDYQHRLRALELSPGYIDLDSHWLMDDDYLLLYSLNSDQVDEILGAVGSQLDVVNLAFELWFEPFYDNVEVPGPASEAVIRRLNGVG